MATLLKILEKIRYGFVKESHSTERGKSIQDHVLNVVIIELEIIIRILAICGSIDGMIAVTILSRIVFPNIYSMAMSYTEVCHRIMIRSTW